MFIARPDSGAARRCLPALSSLALVFAVALLPVIAQATTVVEAEDFTAMSGIVVEQKGENSDSIGLINSGDWTEYSIDVAAAGTYQFDFRVASDTDGGTIGVLAAGSTIGTATITSTGGWETWETVSIEATLPTSGPQTLRLNFTGVPTYLYNIDWFSYQPVPIHVEAEDYSAMDGIELETTTDTGGGFNIAYISNGDWTEYTVNLLVPGDYRMDFRVASDNNDSGTIAISADGSPIGSVFVPDTNGWQTWTTVSTTVTFSAAGQQTLRLDFQGGGGSLFNVNWLSIVCPEPEPDPVSLTVGNELKQQMRYGIDYERLWFWQGSSSVRDRFAEWSVDDCDVDYVRVAINAKYELTEGVYQEDAYFDDDDDEGGKTNNDRIIPMMRDMRDANPDIKFFASPRPLNEATNNVAWQPYPQWITGSSGSGDSFSFDEVKCSQYLLRYLILMKHYGFKISYMDLTNEWNYVTGTDVRDISGLFDDYLDGTKPVIHPDYPDVTLTVDDIPQLIAPSAWSYSQGRSWLSGVYTGLRRDALDIAACHNTDRGGTAQDFADRLVEIFTDEDTGEIHEGETLPEIWNTEVHGWKSTSDADEVLTYAYMLECINAGFSGLNGWLALGFSDQGHCYIVNSQRSVKYYMFEKLTNTSNRGFALDVNEPDEFKVYWDPDPDQEDADSAVSALIRGNLMTVWVLNHSDTDHPVTINPTGRTISEFPIRATRWSQFDGLPVEGETESIPAETDTSVYAIVQDNSAYCFEILLEPEVMPYTRIQAESFDGSNPANHSTESCSDTGGGLNLSNINDGDWIRFDDVLLSGATSMRFRIAAPSGRPDGVIEVRIGSDTGTVIGRTAVPVTGGWQNWETIETPIDPTTGMHDVYLKLVEADSNQTGSGGMFNLNWFELQIPESPASLVANPATATEIDLSWNAVAGATGYAVKRSTTMGGPYTTVATNISSPTFTDTELTAGTPYFYVVTALFDEVESDISTEISVIPSDPVNEEQVFITSPALGSDGPGDDYFTFTYPLSQSGHDHQVQATEDLTDSDWQDVGDPVPGNGGELVFEIAIEPGQSLRFYRVEVSRQ